MAGFIRVERCPTQDVAERRRTALTELGFSVKLFESEKHVLKVEVDADSQVDDSIIWNDAPWVVVGTI